MSDDEPTLERLQAAEAFGEAGYDRMYDAHSYRDAKDAYDDAREGLFRAMRLALALGRLDDEARLRARLEHVISVWSSQFRS